MTRNDPLFRLILAVGMIGSLATPGRAKDQPAKPEKNADKTPIVSADVEKPKVEPTSKPTSKPSFPFENEIVAYEKKDADNPPAPGCIVFVGSSSIRKWTTLGHDFPDLPVLNRGFGGSQLADSVRVADRIVIPYRPSQIVVYAGDNDIHGGKSPEKVASDFKAFVAKVRAALPDVKIHYISIKPSISRLKEVEKQDEANALIKEFIESGKNLNFIDIRPGMLGEDGKPRPEMFVGDGLHMTPKGYEIWTEIVKKELGPAPTK